MSRYIIISLVLLISLAAFAQAEPDSASADIRAMSDSLLKIIEARLKTEYGITDSNTLKEAADSLQLNLTALKEQLGLDADNTRLDKMRLRQLGIPVYSILLAQETLHYGFNDTNTLRQISEQHKIPLKRLKYLLGLDPVDQTLNDRTIQSLNLPIDSVLSAQDKFRATLGTMGNNIILVGIIVVFSALFITSIIILQLKHINLLTQDKPAQDHTKAKKPGALLSTHPTVTNDEIVAAISALEIHRYQLEERRRLALTFRRGSARIWRAVGLLNMPNRGLNRK